jgi:hypothetical protein
MATSPIAIINASFEAENLSDGDYNKSLVGWTNTGSSGTHDPKDKDWDVSTVTGENVAWIEGNGARISQTLSETFQDGAVYSFDFDLGDDDKNSAAYTINIYAGSTIIGTISGKTTGNEELSTVNVSSAGFSNPALNGKALRIEVVKTSGKDLFVDNVRGEVSSGPDGVVDGEDTDEVMDVGYDDGVGETDGGGDRITNGDDSIVGNGGNDTIDGGDGNDTIFGDATGAPVGPPAGRAHFAWEDVPDPDNGGQIDAGDRLTSGMQTVGNVTVTYIVPKNAVEYDTVAQYVDGIDSGGQPINDSSKVTFEKDGTTQMLFSQAVGNVSFRVSDFENYLETLTIHVYDPSDKLLIYTAKPGSAVKGIDTDEALGFDTFVGIGHSANDASPSGSVLFDIPGPVARIDFIFVSHGGSLAITDIYFDDPGPPEVEGDDSIFGGAGDDVIDSGGGDDKVSGGTGNDTIIAQEGTSTIDGGAGTDTYDANGSSSLIDDAISVKVTSAGMGTVSKTDDGTTDTVTSVERFIADEVEGRVDVITVTDPIVASAVSGLNDTAVGVFTPNNGGPDIAFGGRDQPTINEILLGEFNPSGVSDSYKGTYSISRGEEDGAQLGNIYAENFEELNFNVVCFVHGTMIETACGPRPIEALSKGDLIWTSRGGYRPIRWIGFTSVPAKGRLAPVRIQRGVLGNDADLWVSQQHRMVLSGWKVELLMGHEKVLASAKSLVGHPGIEVVPGGRIDYFHMLFDRHEIVLANGAESESFYPGATGLDVLSAEVQAEIFVLFPELAKGLDRFGPLAMPCLAAYEAGLLVQEGILPLSAAIPADGPDCRVAA